MKIGFFTPRSLQPLHARLVVFEQYFTAKGFSVEFINESNYRPTFSSRISWLVLWFFDLQAIQRCKKYVHQFDLIVVTDMKYLPLVKYAHRAGKVVFYDTIDHNVFLRFYQLEAKLPFMRIFKSWITKLFIRIEKRYAERYCDEIFVNSEALYDYFDKKPVILFYSSPLESINVNNKPDNALALLYLGAFRYDKSAAEIISFSKKLKLPLFVFGPVEDAVLLERMNDPNIFYSPKISMKALTDRLRELMAKYYFFGFSLTKPAHLSYEVQEANKDIDYLALGIPFIGNYRIPTKVKVDAGCGVFIDDPELETKIHDPLLRGSYSANCKAYYQRHYHSSMFAQNLDRVLAKYMK